MTKTRWDTQDALTFLKSTLLPYRVCWHIGTLQREDKGWGSHEGSGLSVSLDPTSWRFIARLDGPLYRLEKAGASFADAHACLRTPTLLRHMWAWALFEHYIERKRMYRVDRYDDEHEEWDQFSFLDGKQAKAEYLALHADGTDRGVRYSSFTGYVPSARMAERMRHSILPLAFVRDFALSLFVDEHLPEVDGIWWQDEDRPVELSAPRGVIFERQVQTWTRTRVPSR